MEIKILKMEELRALEFLKLINKLIFIQELKIKEISIKNKLLKIKILNKIILHLMIPLAWLNPLK
jgi:hypothetical protein